MCSCGHPVAHEPYLYYQRESMHYYFPPLERLFPVTHSILLLIGFYHYIMCVCTYF